MEGTLILLKQKYFTTLCISIAYIACQLNSNFYQELVDTNQSYFCQILKIFIYLVNFNKKPNK